MYITLFIIVLIVGLLMVLLPSKAIKNLVNQNGVLVVLRLLGIIMCVKAKLFCPEIAGLFCRIAGLFCHDSRANLSLKPVCFGIAIS